MRKLLLIGLLAVLCLVACAPTYTVREYGDPVLGHRQVRLDLNTLAGGCVYCGSIELNIAKYISASGTVAYDLVVDYRSQNDWLFIESGQSLTLRIDGELVRLWSERGSSPYRSVGYGGSVHETAYYPIDPGLLLRIADASEVLVRVEGSSYYATREFRQENFDNFRQFIAEHVN